MVAMVRGICRASLVVFALLLVSVPMAARAYNIAPPTVSLSLSPGTVYVNQPSTLTVTLTNPNSGASITNISVGVSFEASGTIGAIISDNCHGAGTTSANSFLQISGVTLAPSASCTITVPASGDYAANYPIEAFGLSSTGYNSGLTLNASTSLHVIDPPPGPSATFSITPSTVTRSRNPVATITLSNTTANRLDNVVLTINHGREVSLNDLSNPCGTLYSQSGLTTLTAASLAPGASCTATFSISYFQIGDFTWTPVSLTSTQGNGTPPQPVSLTVVLPQTPPTMTFTLGSTRLRVGESTLVTVTTTNPGTLTMTGTTGFINVTRDRSTQPGPILSNDCPASHITSNQFGHTLDTATLAPGASCTFTFMLKAIAVTTTGQLNTGRILSDISATGENYFVSVTIVQPVRVSLDSARNPAAQGRDFVMDASVTPAGGTITNGTFDFTVDGQPVNGCTGLPYTAVVHCSTQVAQPGTVTVRATYVPANGSTFDTGYAEISQVIEPGPIDQTFVSGVGDDANDCSRTAPCQTFARALERTSDGGAIDCLDAGGFGPVTIDKSVTIRCRKPHGGVIASGVNGITIAAPANANVVLDGLTLEGLGRSGATPGNHGIAFTGGASLTIRNTVIRGFRNSYGIAFTPSANALLTLDNVTVSDNGNVAVTDSGGVLVRPTALSVARVIVTHSRIDGNAGAGMRLDATWATGATVTASMSGVTLSANGAVGLLAKGGPASTVQASFARGTITGSPNAVVTNGAASRTLISGSAIQGNGVGLMAGGGGSNASGGANMVDANTTNGSFTEAVSPR